MEIMTHLMSLSVGTNGDEQHARTYARFSELSKELVREHDYVTLSSQLVVDGGDDEDLDEECSKEHLYYDEDTLVTVRTALTESVREEFSSPDEAIEQIVTDMISRMLSAGILFRERCKEA